METVFCVDWLTFTIPGRTPQQIQDLLNLSDVHWVEGSGHQGFRHCLEFRGIGINWDSMFPNCKGIVMLTLSGEGCRTYEEIFGCPVYNLLVAFDWKVTRLDLAVDDKSNDLDVLLDMDTIFSHMDRRNPKMCHRFQEWEKSDGPRKVEARLGDRTSMTYLRIYDKRLERKKKTGEYPPWGHWVRLELELKEDHAIKAAQEIVRNPEGMSLRFLAVLRDYVEFIDESESSFSDRNARRDGTRSTWWLRFCNRVVPLKLQAGEKRLKEYQSVRRYMDQCVRSIAIYEAVEGTDALRELAYRGREKFRPDDLRMIDDEVKERRYAEK